jgi:putative ABC transport system permease protein
MRVLAWCVRLFPQPFRTEFGPEVLAQATRDHARACARGRLRGVWMLIVSALNIVASAAAERFHPTWITGSPSPKGIGMRGILDLWRLDFTYASRALRRTPGFTAVTVLTLSLAMGVTAGIFSVVNVVLIQPLPFGHADRLVYVAGTAPGSDMPAEFGASSEFFVHYRQRATLLEDVAVFNNFTSTLRVGDRVERVPMAAPTYTLFSALGNAPILGRLPEAADASNTAVISHTLWQTWFGGREDVIGQAHSMGGSTRTIIGVMGPEFRFPNDGTLLWLPFDIRDGDIAVGRFGGGMVARTVPGASTDDVARELTSLAKELPGRFGGSAGYARVMDQYIAVVRPLADQVVGAAARPLWVLLGAAGIVLLIACANVANLFMVRAEGRQREMAVRQAIGAQRGQLLRVQMSEVLLVSMAAGVLAVLFARLTLPAFVRLAPAGLPRLSAVGVDAMTILFTAVVALGAGLLCGLLPALRASRPAVLRLRDGSRGATRGRLFARNALVVAQTAMALVLLIASGLLLRSHANLSRVNPGYDVRDVFTFQIAPEQPALVDGPTYAQFWLSFMDRLRAMPGVQAVGIIENVPLDESLAPARFLTETGTPDTRPLINMTFAGGDYFAAMGISVLAGRPFTREDAVSSLGHVVVSRTAARMLWPGQDPIGRRLQRDGLTTWETVVGVVDDVMQSNFREPATPLVYFPLTGQLPTQWRLTSPGFVVKSTRADTIAPEIRHIVRDVAPEAPMYRTYTMATLAQRSMLALSFTMLTLGLVSALALILGAVGLYGVLSYVVTERTREIGVRMALGAQAGGVRRMVVAQGARVMAVGVGIGLAVAAASTQALGALLYGVNALDPVVFVGTAITMACIGLAASYVPARRASNVDPIESLRGD